MSWGTVSVAEISSVVTKGTTPTTYGMPFVESGINFIKAEALNGYSSLDKNGFSFISESTHEKLLRSQLQEDDILITIAGANVGKCGLVRTQYLPANTNQAVGIIRVRKELVDPRFVYYSFKQPSIINLCRSIGGQSAQPNINLTNLKAFKIDLPDLLSQKRIASILSAYDDLIENNRRRIQLLEQAARLLYKEWFVHLRFPGHEHVKIIDGVPEGWKRKVLGDVCFEVRETVSPATLEPNTPYIGLENMPRRSITLCEWGQAEQVTSSKHRYREGEILFGKIRPYFHKVGIALTDGVASSDAIIIRPVSPHLLALVLMTISSDGFVAVTAQQMKEGSKMPRADWKQMQQYPVPQPPDGVLRVFNNFIDPILTQLTALSFSNRKLNTVRDLLLPRLLSGEVSV